MRNTSLENKEESTFIIPHKIIAAKDKIIAARNKTVAARKKTVAARNKTAAEEKNAMPLKWVYALF